MTVWDSQDSMRRFMTSGSHRVVMPHLLDWCDEASVVHWDQPGDGPPTWNEADKHMRESGRASKVKFPSARHANLSYRTPRGHDRGANPSGESPGGIEPGGANLTDSITGRRGKLAGGSWPIEVGNH